MPGRKDLSRPKGHGHGPYRYTVSKLSDHASCLPQLPQILPPFRVSSLQTNTDQGVLAKQPGPRDLPTVPEGAKEAAASCPQARVSETSDKASGFHISGQSHHAGGQ